MRETRSCKILCNLNIPKSYDRKTSFTKREHLLKQLIFELEMLNGGKFPAPHEKPDFC